VFPEKFLFLKRLNIFLKSLSSRVIKLSIIKGNKNCFYIYPIKIEFFLQFLRMQVLL
jgi:hypothetical protein